MKDVSDHRLTCRHGTWYYRRRVPKHLVAVLGRSVIQHSLATKDKKAAKELREVEDLTWSARFAALEAETAEEPDNGVPVSISPEATAELVRSYVERMDRRFERSLAEDGAANRDELTEARNDADFGLSVLGNPGDPRADEWVTGLGDRLLKEAGHEPDSLVGEPYARFAELVRRGLLELSRRKLARYDDRFDRSFFDVAFDPNHRDRLIFGQLAEQYLARELEAAEVNDHSKKWTDKVKAQVALVRELIDDGVPVEEVDYDACLRARSLLARIPSNRTKLYPNLSLEAAAKRAKADGRPLLSPITQAGYLSTLRDILELATRKRLLPSNPAQGLRPLKRDETKAADKRLPFTPEQLKAFFGSEFYQSCAPGAAVPYTKPDRDWRFWLPLLSLFMGMRPNEACQMLTADVKRTKAGTWYVEIVASSDNDEEQGEAGKSLKTSASRRKIPVHPELIALGFLQFVEARKNAGGGRLFQGITPDTYGNYATYPLKRFRDTFLPAALTLERRQSFYSFRHSFRDALRRCDAKPDTLKALGGWSQGSLVSDHYGSQFDPDHQKAEIAKVSFPGLDLSFLHVPKATE